MSRLLTFACLLLAVPVLGVLGSWLGLDAASLLVLRHQFDTVLPEYALNSLLLALTVAVGVALLGGATAALVTLFDFPLRRVFEWALLLPLAMPAYVLAYASTDFLQFSGPLQTALRGLDRRQRRAVARRAQPVGRGRAVRAVPVPVRLPADARRAGRTRGAADGSRPAARRRHRAPRARGGAAAGPPGAGRRRGAGADGDAGRLRRRRLLRPVDLHHRHLQGLAGDERPRRRGATGLAAAGAGGAAAVGGAARAEAPALRRHAQRRGACRRGAGRSG